MEISISAKPESRECQAVYEPIKTVNTRACGVPGGALYILKSLFLASTFFAFSMSLAICSRRASAEG